jgi:hypothetical protein
MRVDYISILKVATSYKFLFKDFWSIKYSASGCFLNSTLLLFWWIFLLIFHMDNKLMCRVDERCPGWEERIARQNRVVV